jgi:hypothetical protein
MNAADVVHKYKIRKKYTAHVENILIPGYKLMIEESGKSDVHESTLSVGLCGVVTASGCELEGSCDWRNCHSVTDVRETDTTSGGGLFTNAPGSTDAMPLTPGVACSSKFVSVPSTSVFDDGSPGRGPGKVVGGGVRLLSKATSKGKEEKDGWVGEGVAPTGPRHRV